MVIVGYCWVFSIFHMQFNLGNFIFKFHLIFILTIQTDPEDDKIQIILEGVRNIILASSGDMQETDHFQVS